MDVTVNVSAIVERRVIDCCTQRITCCIQCRCICCKDLKAGSRLSCCIYCTVQCQVLGLFSTSAAKCKHMAVGIIHDSEGYLRLQRIEDLLIGDRVTRFGNIFFKSSDDFIRFLRGAVIILISPGFQRSIVEVVILYDIFHPADD